MRSGRRESGCAEGINQFLTERVLLTGSCIIGPDREKISICSGSLPLTGGARLALGLHKVGARCFAVLSSAIVDHSLDIEISDWRA